MFALAPGVLIAEFDVAPADSFLLQTARGRFMLSRSAVELIRALDGKASVDELARTPAEAAELKRFVEQQILPTGAFDASAPSAERLGPPRADYVYAARELVPTRWLRPLSQVARHLFRPWIAGLLMLAGLAAQAVFWSSHWELRLENIPGEAYALGTLLFVASMPFHELGHAAACRYFGAEHGAMGFAMYLLFPCFYTDVSDSWRLSRWQRVAIDLGGVYLHVVSAGIFALLALWTGQAAWAAAAAFVNWCIVHSLKPYLRGDGYWVLMDVLGLPAPYKRVREYLAFRVRHLMGRPATPPLLASLPRGLRVFAVGYVFVSLTLAAWVVATLAWKTATAILPAYPALLQRWLELPAGSWAWWRTAVAAGAQGVVMACLGLALWNWTYALRSRGGRA